MWVLPFNSVRPSSDIFFYLKNLEEHDLILEEIKISSTMKSSNMQIYSVVNEPVFSRPLTIRPFNKILQNSETPNVLAIACADAQYLGILGQLDRLELPTELTTYISTPRLIIPQGTALVISCSSSEGDLSGIITIGI